eukprot:GAFH01002152.1.p2 GENE.GAFH01002152.1~~GAFH01002152.1.p2  ORF type:complete len:210 (+),score=28.35 GAFH01002152.1:403-1032(+)
MIGEALARLGRSRLEGLRMDGRGTRGAPSLGENDDDDDRRADKHHGAHHEERNGAAIDAAGDEVPIGHGAGRHVGERVPQEGARHVIVEQLHIGHRIHRGGGPLGGRQHIGPHQLAREHLHLEAALAAHQQGGVGAQVGPRQRHPGGRLEGAPPRAQAGQGGRLGLVVEAGRQDGSGPVIVRHHHIHRPNGNGPPPHSPPTADDGRWPR